MAPSFVFSGTPYIVLKANKQKLMIPAFHHKKIKSQNLRDSETQSAIDPKDSPM